MAYLSFNISGCKLAWAIMNVGIWIGFTADIELSLEKFHSLSRNNYDIYKTKYQGNHDITCINTLADVTLACTCKEIKSPLFQ